MTVLLEANVLKPFTVAYWKSLDSCVVFQTKHHRCLCGISSVIGFISFLGHHFWDKKIRQILEATYWEIILTRTRVLRFQRNECKHLQWPMRVTWPKPNLCISARQWIKSSYNVSIRIIKWDRRNEETKYLIKKKVKDVWTHNPWLFSYWLESEFKCQFSPVSVHFRDFQSAKLSSICPFKGTFSICHFIAFNKRQEEFAYLRHYWVNMLKPFTIHFQKR